MDGELERSDSLKLLMLDMFFELDIPIDTDGLHHYENRFRARWMMLMGMWDTIRIDLEREHYGRG